MTLQLQTSRVLFSQLDFDDLLCKLSPGPVAAAAPALLASLARFGPLHPPILRRKNNDLYQIVTGHQRLTALRDQLHHSAANCLLLPSTATEQEALAVALEEILIRRPVTAMERAAFFARILRYQGKAEAAAAFLPLLGMNPSTFLLDQQLRLVDLEEPLAIAVQQGRLHEAVAHELLEVGFAERLALFEIIDYLQLSVGNQKKLVGICRELAKRENCTILHLLGNAEIRAILDHPEANPPQKAANLLRHLTERQFPQLSAAEERFRQFTAGLHLPKGAALNHTQSFEDDKLQLTLEFASPAALKEALPNVLAALGDKQAG